MQIETTKTTSGAIDTIAIFFAQQLSFCSAAGRYNDYDDDVRARAHAVCNQC